MRSVLLLMLVATALCAQPPSTAQTNKPKPKTTPAAPARAGAKPATPGKPIGNQTAPGKSNSKSTTQSTRASGSRRLVNGRWVSTSRRTGPPRLVGQQHPEPARYQEIQKALLERGYYKGEPTGQWSDQSVDALKRFQADQKLPNDGKLNSLTLIGLGLGPKHDAGPITPPPAASLPPATPPPISPETVPVVNKPPSK